MRIFGLRSLNICELDSDNNRIIIGFCVTHIWCVVNFFSVGVFEGDSLRDAAQIHWRVKAVNYAIIEGSNKIFPAGFKVVSNKFLQRFHGCQEVESSQFEHFFRLKWLKLQKNHFFNVKLSFKALITILFKKIVVMFPGVQANKSGKYKPLLLSHLKFQNRTSPLLPFSEFKICFIRRGHPINDFTSILTSCKIPAGY